MDTITLIEENGDRFEEILAGDGGRYFMCRNCLANGHCNYNKPKVLQVSQYLLGFIYDFNDLEIKRYPFDGAFDSQPHWFVSLFKAGLGHLRKLRGEKANERKAKI